MNRQSVLCCTSLVLAVSHVLGGVPTARIDGAPTAKALVTCELTVPTRIAVADIALAISRDGNSYEEARAGFPRAWQIPKSIDYQSQTAVISVPLVARFSGGPSEFLFDRPGKYYLRWTVTFEGANTAPEVILQELTVATAREQDLIFCQRVTEEQVLQQLFDEKAFGGLRNKPSSAQCILILRKLLEATQKSEPLEGASHTPESVRTWLSLFSGLVSDLPDSSYRKLAAFYAGAGAISYVAESSGPHVRVREDSQASILKAREDLQVAIDHGDIYLTPRARLQLIRADALVGQWDIATASIAQLRQEIDGRGTTAQLLVEVEQDCLRLKQKRDRQTP